MIFWKCRICDWDDSGFYDLFYTAQASGPYVPIIPVIHAYPTPKLFCSPGCPFSYLTQSHFSYDYRPASNPKTDWTGDGLGRELGGCMIEKMQRVVTLGPCFFSFFFSYDCAYEYPFPNIYIHILYFFLFFIKSYITFLVFSTRFEPFIIINRCLSLLCVFRRTHSPPSSLSAISPTPKSQQT